jgi:hypothetical protein
MGRYRKVDSKIWNDDKFRSLTDDGKLVFLFILTHPHMTGLGAMRATIPGLAAELKWSTKAFQEAFGEALRKGIIEYDEDACFVGLPNFIKYNPPESANVVKSWGKVWTDIPECSLQVKLYERVKGFLEAFHEGYLEAYMLIVKQKCEQPSGNQEQEQEQEQELKHTSPPAPCSSKDQVLEVIDHYKTYHPTAMRNPQPASKEWKKICDRLKEGYTVEQLKLAIDGNHRSPHHCGKNDSGTLFHGLELIFRDASKVDGFVEMASSNGSSEVTADTPGAVWNPETGAFVLPAKQKKTNQTPLLEDD